MITYKPFWETLKKSPETTYTLIHKHQISSATIDDLCHILNCQVGEIAAYIPPEDKPH